MDTLRVTLGMPVFLGGVTLGERYDDLTGIVVEISKRDDTITVQWDHPNMPTGPLTYDVVDEATDAARFQDTTDRDGTRWLVLDL
jgi:hypothetical protein